MGDVSRHIFGPVLGRVEGDDTDRLGVLPAEEVLDHGLQVGGFVVGPDPGAAWLPKISRDQVDRLVVLIGHDRRRPIGLTHKATPRNRTGTQIIENKYVPEEERPRMSPGPGG